MFEKVVACLDGSSLAEQILPYTIEEAMHFNSKVVLLQVFTPPLPVLGGMVAADRLRAEIEEEENRIKTYLEGLAQPLRDKGLVVECVVLRGNPGEQIVTYTHENEVGLVAIAFHRRHGLARVVFGSTADFVLKESHLPVLLVKPPGSEK